VPPRQESQFTPFSLTGGSQTANHPTPGLESDLSQIIVLPYSPQTITTIPDLNKPEKILGGYDGGSEVGFIGEWNERKFDDLKLQLEQARMSAEYEHADESYVTVGKFQFRVNAHGAKFGGFTYYKFVLEGAGMKIYLHNNPKGEIQGVRVRYGAECATGRDLFLVHAEFLEWLSFIGFKVTQETVSRADMQTMTFDDFDEYLKLLQNNQFVQRADKHYTHGDSKRFCSSYTCGTAIELCIYDKRQELHDNYDEVKLALIVNECLAGEFPDTLTRIEFRLKRDALKYFGVTTMQDLMEKETAIIDFLTFDWFRLLAEEKDSKNGHERQQKLHPLWEKVREQFFKYFPGPVENRKPIERNLRGRREVKCTGENLIKQAVGCLATAAALAKGVFETAEEAIDYATEVITEKVTTFFERTRQRAVELGIVRGVESPEARDWHLDPRQAAEIPDELPEIYRIVFDEGLQYEKFQQTAVAGCPF
jgi:hypothetical protein